MFKTQIKTTMTVLFNKKIKSVCHFENFGATLNNPTTHSSSNFAFEIKSSICRDVSTTPPSKSHFPKPPIRLHNRPTGGLTRNRRKPQNPTHLISIPFRSAIVGLSTRTWSISSTPPITSCTLPTSIRCFSFSPLSSSR